MSLEEKTQAMELSYAEYKKTCEVRISHSEGTAEPFRLSDLVHLAEVMIHSDTLFIRSIAPPGEVSKKQPVVR